MQWHFPISVTIFQVHFNFPTSARTFQPRWNFPTSPKLSNFGRNFPFSLSSFNFARSFQMFSFSQLSLPTTRILWDIINFDAISELKTSRFLDMSVHICRIWYAPFLDLIIFLFPIYIRFQTKVMFPMYRLCFQSNSYVSNIQIMFPISYVCFKYTVYVSKRKWCFQTTMFPMYVSNKHGADISHSEWNLNPPKKFNSNISVYLAWVNFMNGTLASGISGPERSSTAIDKHNAAERNCSTWTTIMFLRIVPWCIRWAYFVS